MEKENKKSTATVNKTQATDAYSGKVLTQLQTLEYILDNLRNEMESLISISPENSITDSQRRSLLGSGVRRYGFIDKVSDIATTNSVFIPPFLSISELKSLMRIIEVERGISAALQQMLRINNDNLLTRGDLAYQMALMYYNSVRDASRRRIQGAKAIFEELRSFFKRTKRITDEPTENEVERDVKALLKGKKDGKIVIENERPHLTGGKHLVVDETRKDKAAFKETEEM
jgi:hypothetical protein